MPRWIVDRVRAALGALPAWLLAAAGCAHAPSPPPPAEPEHIPGTTADTEAIPAAEAPAAPPRATPAGDPDGDGQPRPRATLVSGHDPEDGRLHARPHPPRSAARATGTHRLGLGGERDGVVVVPPGYDPARPTPLVVLLHGAKGDAERILRAFRDRAERDGIILVVPESRAYTWDLVIQHTFGPDVAFIDRALAQAFDRWNIDPARVTVAGFSDGASYALSLGLTNGDLFGQIVALSPGFAAPGLVTGQPRVFIAHGVSDRVLPINGASRRMVPILEQTGYDVRFKQFDGGHEMPPAVLDAAFSWLSTGR
jgi:predicted esterase